MQRVTRGAAMIGSLFVGGGSAVKKIKAVTATIDFASAAAGLADEQTVTVAGVAVGDIVLVAPPAAPDAGAVFFAYVSAADTVKVRFVNNTAGAVDPASGAYTLLWFDLT